MTQSYTKSNRLDVWGHGLLNKLRAVARQRRKRQASKKRRVILKQEDARRPGEP